MAMEVSNTLHESVNKVAVKMVVTGHSKANLGLTRKWQIN